MTAGMSSLPQISDEQRRIRLMRRHRLGLSCRAGSIGEVVDSMVALHATTPSTVYLSTWARMTDFTPAQMDVELYENRSLVKHLAMRRTMFVFGRDTLAEAVGALGPRVSASERTNMLRDLRRSPDFDDEDGWIDGARAAVLEELSDGSALSARQLRERLPALDGYVTIAADKSWGGRSPMGPRVLSMMSAAGEIVRGPNTAGWHLSRPRWSLMSAWLGAPLPEIPAAEGYRALIERWLRTFGPGTETDIVWWLGATKRDVRAALAELDLVEVQLDSGATGYVLADDVEPDEPVEPTALLLPELDSTTMGHKERDFYLGAHVTHLFDRNGNGGQSAWWDGRIVGGWYRDADGAVRVHLFEKVARRASKAFDERADELTAWLGDVRPTPGFPAPFMKDVVK